MKDKDFKEANKKRTSEEFNKLIEEISGQVVEANYRFRLHTSLWDTFRDDRYQDVLIESNTFWWMTSTAHYYAAVHCLCRVFDQEKASLHLRSFLIAVQANCHLFSEVEFRKRLKDNDFVDELAKTQRTLDGCQLKKDLDLCGAQDDLVNHLIQYRHNYLGHIGMKNLLNKKKNQKDDDTQVVFPISISDLEILLKRASEIVNRYTNLFKAESYSIQVVGHDDYKYVFDYMALGLKVKREDEMGLSSE